MAVSSCAIAAQSAKPRTGRLATRRSASSRGVAECECASAETQVGRQSPSNANAQPRRVPESSGGLDPLFSAFKQWHVLVINCSLPSYRVTQILYWAYTVNSTKKYLRAFPGVRLLRGPRPALLRVQGVARLHGAARRGSVVALPREPARMSSWGGAKPRIPLSLDIMEGGRSRVDYILQ